MTIFKGLGLKSALGTAQAVDPDDVATAKSALTRTGDYDPTPFGGLDGIPDRGVFDGIARFQEREGLKVDGVMRPGGETERALGALFGLDDDGPDAEERFAERRRIIERIAQRRDTRGPAAPYGGTGATDPRAHPASRPNDPMSDPAFGAWRATDADRRAEDVAGITVPDYRAQVIDQHELARWTRVLKEADLGPKATRALQEFFVAEGGARGHPGSETFAGLTQKTVSDFAESVGLRPDTSPKDLKPEERVAILRAHIGESNNAHSLGMVGGLDALERIGDPHAAAALADTLFSGPDSKKRALALQKAINAVAPGSLKEDSLLSMKTLSAFARIARSDDSRSDLLNALADERIRNVKESDIPREEIPGWIGRINHFRFHK